MFKIKNKKIKITLKIIFIIVVIIGVLCLFDLIVYACGYNFHKVTFPGFYRNNIDQKTIKRFFRINETFQDSVVKGRDAIKNKKVVICGLARNVSTNSPNFMDKILQLTKGFEEYKVVIYENDSTDNTRNIIKKYASADKNIILLDCCDEGSCDCKLNETHPKIDEGGGSSKRIDKMAEIRNLYLDHVKQNYGDYDYMVVFDVDITGGIFMDGYYSSFGKKWDVVAARGIRGRQGSFGFFNTIYDILAFVPAEDNFEDGYGRKKYTKQRRLLHTYLKNDVGGDLIPVKSAFNGMAIYKINDIIDNDIKYDSKTRCEHIDLHFQLIRKNKHIYMDPSLILQIGNDLEIAKHIKKYLG